MCHKLFHISCFCLWLAIAPVSVQGQVIPENPCLQEKLYIHTDRDLLIAGEQLLFSLYLFNGNEGDKSSYAYLVLRNEREVVDHQRLQLANGRAQGGFYLEDTLSTGYYELLGFTNWMRNQEPSTIFRKHVFIANRFDQALDLPYHEEEPPQAFPAGQAQNPVDIQLPSLTLTASDSIIGQRTKGSIQIQNTGSEEIHGQFSLSVVPDKASFAHNQSIIDYTLPQRHGNDPHTPTNQSSLYFMETQGIIISGKVTDSNGKTVAGSRVILNKQDTLVNLQYADTCEEGLFHFLLGPYYDNATLFFSLAPGNTQTDKSIYLFDKTEVNFPFSAPPAPLCRNQIDYFSKSQDIVSVQKVYNLQHHGKTKDPDREIFPPLLYSEANHRYNPGDYIPLNDVYEIANELIPAWRIRGRGENANHLMTDATSKQRMGETPVFFADGVLTGNIIPYLDLGSDDLLRIETHDFHWQHGDMYFPGIIGVFTKDPVLNFEPLEDDYVTREIDSPAIPLSFKSPVYEDNDQRNSEKPDARQVLLWEPDISFGENQTIRLPFYTSDLSGRYVITLQGMTEQGKPVFEQQYIEVQ